MENQPNILWYCTDQQRYDTIRCLGYEEINTPVLDRLAATGVAFRNAYTQCPICTPSRASFLTGRYPASHHVHRNGNAYFPPSEKLVTKLFAEAGYDCGLVGKLHLAGAQRTREARADDGYRFYAWSHHPYPDIEGNTFTDWLRNEKRLDPEELFLRIDGSYGVGLPEELHQTTWCTEMALRFIDERREGPWLLSVNPFSPHPTFHPPKEYLSRYDPAKLSLPLFRRSDIERQNEFARVDQQTMEAADIEALGRGKRSGKELLLPKDLMACIAPVDYDPRMAKACCYAEIELIDTQFGRILDALDASGELENTIVVYMSDHGELLGDHGLLFKGCRFFEALVHVPLIISWPARWIADKKSRALVELIDIAPTLLEAADLPIPQSMQGKSLGSLLSGETDLDSHKPYVVSEYNDAMSGSTMVQGEEGYNASHGSMYFDGRYKIVVYHGHDAGELFDLRDDPGEFTNLWNDPRRKDLKCSLLKKHFDAMMATSDAGIERTKDY